MPILPSHSLPVLFSDLDLTLRKFSFQSQLRQLNLCAIAGNAMKKEIVRRQPIEEGVDTTRLD